MCVVGEGAQLNQGAQGLTVSFLPCYPRPAWAAHPGSAGEAGERRLSIRTRERVSVGIESTDLERAWSDPGPEPRASASLVFLFRFPSGVGHRVVV